MKLFVLNISRSVEGGVENIVADLGRNLPRHGIEVLIGLTKGARFNDPVRYKKTFPDLEFVEINDNGKGSRQARVEALEKAIRAARPDVALIARVYDAYEAIARVKNETGWPRLAVTIQAYEPHYLYDAANYRDHIDLCVTSGELVRSGVCKWAGLEKDRVVSIPGGVAPPIEKPAPRRPEAPLRIGYVGRLDPGQKRIFDLVGFVESLERMGVSYQLEIAGSGPAEDELKDKLKTRMERGNVVFHGWLQHQQLYAEMYPSLHAIVHFAHTEGVTIAPREAMAHGVVPVISRFIGLETEGQFVNGRNALTFAVGDVTGAAACVKRLLDEDGLLQRLSENAIQPQQGKYSEQGAIRAWADALHTCLERPAKTAPLPNINYPADGRLARLGISPWLAQRIRDLAGIKFEHTHGSNEWPTGSGLMPEAAAREIMEIAYREEARAAA